MTDPPVLDCEVDWVPGAPRDTHDDAVDAGGPAGAYSLRVPARVAKASIASEDRLAVPSSSSAVFWLVAHRGS